MHILYKNSLELNETEKTEIWEILCQCEDEFYPRLSARNSSSQKNLQITEEEMTEKQMAEKPYTYYEEMIQQEFLLIFSENRMEGFMTFKRNYICEELQEFGESAYITTVCVRKESRRAGLMSEMYGYLEENVRKLCGCSRISTRTWSLNEAQLHALNKRGYAKLSVLLNHRGVGVDTVYYGKAAN